MSQQITSFFNHVNVNKRKVAVSTEDTDRENVPTNNKRQPAEPDNNNNIEQTVTASLKTVKKWEKEFQIPIGYEQSRTGEVVTKIWCEICTKYSTDRSSSLVTGLSRVKKESLGYHVKSTSHERAVAAKLAKELKDQNEITPLEKGSAKRNREAQELAEIMDDHFLKPAKCNGTRWVEHKLLAVSKLLHNWFIIVSHMSNYAEDNTNRGEDRAKAKGIIQKLCQYKFVFYLYFLKDILSEVSRISLTFQRDDINVSSAVTVLQAANATLNDMINNPGAQLLQFDNDVIDNKFHDFTLKNPIERAVLKEQLRRIILGIIDCIQTRFENLHTDELFRACHVFDHKNWPDLNAGDALAQYGLAEIQQIVEHFRPLLQGCDTVAALREWVDLKAYICRNRHFVDVHPLALFQRISVEDSQMNNFQNILKIIHLTSCYPLSNAACERVFSTMKRIKSDWRCRLNNNTLNTLMRINMNEKAFSLDVFEPRPFVTRWWFNGQKSKRPHTVPYGPNQ
uniref:Zinc finger protein 862-like isoform X2 n=1 Tax=Crassostrea virginica TaxID=6565 RepID=A0A8B8AJ86_CRAVI|nr:zinc finger protein 862-like isoform X2 [Crassostrea virginica]